MTLCAWTMLIAAGVSAVEVSLGLTPRAVPTARGAVTVRSTLVGAGCPYGAKLFPGSTVCLRYAVHNASALPVVVNSVTGSLRSQSVACPLTELSLSSVGVGPEAEVAAGKTSDFPGTLHMDGAAPIGCAGANVSIVATVTYGP